MAEYLTAVSIEGREASFKGMANVYAGSADLAEKVMSSSKLEGEIKEVERSSLSLSLGQGMMQVEFNGWINPKSVMPGDHLTIEVNGRGMDRGRIGELTGGSLEMILERNHLF